MQETTQELDGSETAPDWAARQGRPSRHVRVAWAARSDIGRAREHNEDKFDFYFPNDATRLAMRGRLWAIADGMGGHHAGQVASEVALKTIIRTYFSPEAPDDMEAALRLALNRASGLIYRAAKQFEEKAAGMGTTAVIVVVKEEAITIAHVGDSRCYLLRKGERLRQVTTDHSWIEEQVRRGSLSREDAETSPYRNYILRSVGVEPTVEPDITTFAAQPGDTLLLCSDGLSNLVSDATIAATLTEKGPSDAALSLVDAANDAGGKDNITALTLRTLKIAAYNDADTE